MSGIWVVSLLGVSNSEFLDSDVLKIRSLTDKDTNKSFWSDLHRAPGFAFTFFTDVFHLFPIII